MFSLADRKAVVTGGGSGIGRAMAGALAGAGAEVVLVDRARDRLEQACEDIGAAASLVTADLALRTEVDRLCGEVGEVDILVNAAGINIRPPMGS